MKGENLLWIIDFHLCSIRVDLPIPLGIGAEFRARR